MEFLFVILIVAAVWWAVRKNKKTGQPAYIQKKAMQPQPDVPEIKITFTGSLGGGGRRGDAKEANVGALVDNGTGDWVLAPNAPIPLTVIGGDRQLAQQLKDILASSDYWSQKIPDVALLIAQHNIRIKEVDEFLETYRKRFEVEVSRQISESSEWAAASTKDQEDLRSEFSEKAMSSLGVWVGRTDLALLLTTVPGALEEDDALSQRFKDDASLYSFYLNQLGRKGSIVTAKADEPWRKSWEKLVEMKLAKRGKEIPFEQILDSLRLKDLNEILGDSIEKPYGRKTKAIDAVNALPDLETRLSARMSFRELFQVNAPEGSDVSAISSSFAYASEVAALVLQTYFTGAETLDALDERKRERGIYDAWEVRNWEDPVPACAAPFCKKYDRLPSKKPPYHVGCTCVLENSFKDQ
ncbi:MAG: hypothetical protein WCK63_04650 [Betaproteobacteria bacterium]